MEIHQAFITDLKAIGMQAGDHILLHGGYKKFKSQFTDVDQCIDSILHLLGDEGTLLMPALSYEYVDWDNAHFDQVQSKSCVGFLPEYFRLRDESIRSVHLSHSVSAIGKYAQEFCANHHLDTSPVGNNSPFTKLPQYNGKILMLGCGLLPNTSIHGIEELLPVPYVFNGKIVSYTAQCANGDKLHLSTSCHAHYEQCYDRIKNILTNTELRTADILGVECHLIDAAALWKKAAAAIVDDPWYFTDRP
ncbi:MAG: AAC(3) family N-acetyltransferase [Planctomycetes bacterium]|nr:AAC(3) family N-acetyltransferase [Planctomycetota bacterium]